jgi:hypothetical protein
MPLLSPILTTCPAHLVHLDQHPSYIYFSMHAVLFIVVYIETQSSKR